VCLIPKACGILKAVAELEAIQKEVVWSWTRCGGGGLNYLPKELELIWMTA